MGGDQVGHLDEFVLPNFELDGMWDVIPEWGRCCSKRSCCGAEDNGEMLTIVFVGVRASLDRCVIRIGEASAHTIVVVLPEGSGGVCDLRVLSGAVV